MKDENASPIFVVGCGHSGTTFLGRLLGVHSRIGIIPYETSFAEIWPEPCENAQKFFAQCAKFASCCGKARWLEKTPTQIYHIDRILRHFPQGKILLIIRDGRDVAYSNLERYGTLDGGIERWIKGNLAGETFWKHPNVHVVRYEKLVTDLEETVRGILDFLGEAFEEDILRYHEKPVYFFSSRLEKPAAVTGEQQPQYRNWQINQPLFDGRGKWLRLTEEQKETVKSRMGDMLIRYGYTTDLNW